MEEREIKFRVSRIHNGIYQLIGYEKVVDGNWMRSHDNNHWVSGIFNLALYPGAKVFRDQFTGFIDPTNIELYFSDACIYKDDSEEWQTGVIRNTETSKAYIEAVNGDDEGNQDIELHDSYRIQFLGNTRRDPSLVKSIN